MVPLHILKFVVKSKHRHAVCVIFLLCQSFCMVVEFYGVNMTARSLR